MPTARAFVVQQHDSGTSETTCALVVGDYGIKIATVSADSGLRGERRRVLTHMKEQGLIVCQLDGAGRRIVTLVELAWAAARGAARGAPDAAEVLAG